LHEKKKNIWISHLNDGGKNKKKNSNIATNPLIPLFNSDCKVLGHFMKNKNESIIFEQFAIQQRKNETL